MAHAHPDPGIRFRTALIALAAWLIVAALPAPTGAQPPPGARLVDLAALMPHPAELEAEGMTGFGLGWGWSYMTIEEAVTADRYAESRAGFRPRSVPGAETVLRESGWQRFHETALTRSRPEDPILADFSVVSSIEEYATTEGAARAFAAFTDLAALNEGIAGEIELLPEPAPLGDQSVMWSVAGSAQDDPDVQTLALVRMVRVDTRIVSMTMFDIFEPAPIDPAPLERLTSQMVERVERAGELGQFCPTIGPTGIRAASDDRAAAQVGLHLPGLTGCVQRLVNTGASPGRAYYSVLDGTVIRLLDETPEESAEFQSETDTLRRRDRYLLTYAIDRGDERAYYSVIIDRYVDAAAAAAAFAGLEERLRADTDSPLVSFEAAGVPGIGEASATYVRTSSSTGNPMTYSATRIDDIVVTVRLSQTVEPMQATTQSLLLSQVACMEAGDCIQPIPVPPEIVPAEPRS
jgi:hypothetical protein